MKMEKWTREEVQKAFDEGRIHEIQSREVEGGIASVWVKVTDPNRIDNVVACPWYYSIRQESDKTKAAKQ